MPHYLSVHVEPSMARASIESRWVELARERRAIWVKTWYNFELGKRFCWWDAPNRSSLEEVFDDHKVRYDEIIKVALTTPADWRWRED